ncbi:MAG: VOC family protein [Candidatus Latescibacteria bacterium]|nr:VOC family protein [Candidatus Latescibacterota bacterium]
MPTYTLNHLHHETRDVDSAVAFYQKVFGAASEPPFERGGATWVRVHLGDVAIMVTNRPCTDNALGRYQGLDHFGVMTDDFEATIAAIQKEGAHIWFGPTKLDTGMRIAFVSGPDNVKIELMEKV